MVAVVVTDVVVVVGVVVAVVIGVDGAGVLDCARDEGPVARGGGRRVNGASEGILLQLISVH